MEKTIVEIPKNDKLRVNSEEKVEEQDGKINMSNPEKNTHSFRHIRHKSDTFDPFFRILAINPRLGFRP